MRIDWQKAQPRRNTGVLCLHKNSGGAAMLNLSGFIAFHARSRPDALAIKYKHERITYADFDRHITRVSAWMADLGIERGDVVSILMKNSVAFLEIVFATSHLGAIFLPINYRLSRDEIGYILDNSKSKYIFVDQEFLGSIERDIQKIVIDEDLQNSLLPLTKNEVPVPPAYMTGNELFRLMYTSGTTAHPKGVMHTYDNFYWKTFAHVPTLGISEILNYWSFNHSIMWAHSTCRGSGSFGWAAP